MLIGFVFDLLFYVADTFSHCTIDWKEGLEIVVEGTPQCALLCHCWVGKASRPKPREEVPHGQSKYIGRSNSGGRREEDKEGGEVLVDERLNSGEYMASVPPS